ncbi:MAG: hypothetical protein IPK71_35615 [Myxococcales bacterium]|nr:hypothetical protein [Myxococcales bacterium]
MLNPKAVLSAAVGYLRKNPDEVVKAATNATSLKFGVPLASLRWLAGQIQGKKAPKEVEIDSTPPALKFSAVIDAMGTPLRAGASIKIDEVQISADSIRVGIRLRDVKLAVLSDVESPVSMLVRSGALDLSKPGNVVKFLPKKPPAIVEAEDDRIVLDLMQVPKIAANKALRKALSVITPVLGVGAIETDDDHIYVKLKATPAGLGEALGALRR